MRCVASDYQLVHGSGQVDDGMALVERELNTLGSARYYESELLRIRGLLLRQRNAPGDLVAAEDSFGRALSVARAQRAVAFERHTAMASMIEMPA